MSKAQEAGQPQSKPRSTSTASSGAIHVHRVRGASAKVSEKNDAAGRQVPAHIRALMAAIEGDQAAGAVPEALNGILVVGDARELLVVDSSSAAAHDADDGDNKGHAAAPPAGGGDASPPRWRVTVADSAASTHSTLKPCIVEWMGPEGTTATSKQATVKHHQPHRVSAVCVARQQPHREDDEGSVVGDLANAVVKPVLDALQSGISVTVVSHDLTATGCAVQHATQHLLPAIARGLVSITDPAACHSSEKQIKIKVAAIGIPTAATSATETKEEPSPRSGSKQAHGSNNLVSLDLLGDGGAALVPYSTRRDPMLGLSVDGLTTATVAASTLSPTSDNREATLHSITQALAALQHTLQAHTNVSWLALSFTADVAQADAVLMRDQPNTSSTTAASDATAVVRLARASFVVQITGPLMGATRAESAAVPSVRSTLGKAFAPSLTPRQRRHALDAHPVLALVAEAFGGTASQPTGGSAGGSRTFVLGHASSPADTCDATDVESFLAVTSSALDVDVAVRPRVGDGATLIRSIAVDVERTRRMLVLSQQESGAASVDQQSAAQQMLLEQVAESESAMGPLQALCDEAIRRAKEAELAAQREAEALRARNSTMELSAANANLRLSAEKQRAFAQAFRSAFLVGREAQQRKEQELELAGQIRSLKAQLEKTQTQAQAVKGERDRAQYDALRAGKEVRRLKGLVDEAKAVENRLRRQLAEAQEEADTLATKLGLARFEGTAELHELRTQALTSERERDALEARVSALTDEVKELRRSMDAALRDADASAESRLEGPKMDLAAERAKRSAVQRRLEECEAENDKLRQEAVALRVDATEGQLRVDAALRDVEAERREWKHRLQSLAAAHGVEREEYARLLKEGRQMLRELQRVDSFVVKLNASAGLAAPPSPNVDVTSVVSLYRGGAAAVQAWLLKHGLDRYYSGLNNAGFNDVVSLANITEADLIELKVLTGHRRKFLAHTAELQAMLAHHQLTAKASAAVTSSTKLIQDLTQWISDFDATLSIESEAAATAATTAAASNTGSANSPPRK